MPIFVNRPLNLKRISLIGFDMDYTLVRYDTEKFEALTHEIAIEKLCTQMGYPDSIAGLKFDFSRAIVGLVIDKRRGNLLKLSRYGKVKISYHGLKRIPFRDQARIYEDKAVDVKTADYESLDTSFAISSGVLFSQLVQLKSEGVPLPDYRTLAHDVITSINQSHLDGSLKGRICPNLDKYVVRDPVVPALMERYRDEGKRLMIITNSDYNYTKQLLDYALNPYWTKYKSWEEVFYLVITLADKPRFFEIRNPFLKVDPVSGLLSNYRDRVEGGIFQGGNFQGVQDGSNLSGGDILYIGDHIYGDVVSIKKLCSWRTALVLSDLTGELDGIARAAPLQNEIDRLMDEKGEFERELNLLDIARYEGDPIDHDRLSVLLERLEEYNTEISNKLNILRGYFNPYWGEILRAGAEESRYADQVERYACIYMTKVSDLYRYSPKSYFRPNRRILPHESLPDTPTSPR